jgi:uncharacterized 2Fe-2S/4Fe-4S cluster protein (DUF4445 family)
MKEAMIIFQPSGRRGKVPVGETLLEASRRLGVDIESLCGEKMLCGKCRVRIEEGGENLTEFQEEEGKFIPPAERREGLRLACAARIRGDVLVFVPEESRVSNQVIRKAATKRRIKVDPAVKLYCLTLKQASIADPLGDFERLTQALEERYGLKDTTLDLEVLRSLGTILRKGNWQVTTSVWNDREVIRIRPGKVINAYGLAIDIGTTTVAGYLCDLVSGEVLSTHSLMNPQVTYGEDVMSRITYHMMHPDGGLRKLSQAIVETLNSLVVSIVEETNLTPADIEDMTIVGNTAMHHILLQINPAYVATAPFPPAIHHSIDVKARDIGIRINPSSYIHVLPIEAGFVGADNVGVLIAEEPHKKGNISLIIDIGTNGELVLGNKGRLMSSSCATGPALEGAQLTFGMRAAPGAIERVTIDPQTHEVNFKVIGRDEWSQYSRPEEIKAKGICGSGVLDILAELYRCGIILKSGAFSKNQRSNRYRISQEDNQPEFVIAWREETSIGRDITISLKDIRQIQLAKGAIYTGCKLMMRRMGINRVDRVLLAGAFGSYVDPERALIIGMIPDCDLSKVYSVGNAAGDGARIALLNRNKRIEADRIAKKVEYLELTAEEDFQTEFMYSLQLPHMRDRFPHLEDIVPDDILNQQ